MRTRSIIARLDLQQPDVGSINELEEQHVAKASGLAQLRFDVSHKCRTMRRRKQTRSIKDALALTA
jgi:hypothetical protein